MALSQIKNRDWRLLVTRDLPLVRFYMIAKSYQEESKRKWGWAYNAGCVISKKGIINVYRRDKYLRRGADYFKSLKDKKAYLEKFLDISKAETDKLEVDIIKIKKELRRTTQLDEEKLTIIFQDLYGKFKRFWIIQNFTFTLDACFRKTGQEIFLKLYEPLIKKIRSLTQDKTIILENLIDEVLEYLAKELKLKQAILFNSTPGEIINRKINKKEAIKRSQSYFLIVQGEKIMITSNKKIISRWDFHLKNLSTYSGKVKELKGKTAFPGKVKGRVKIIIKKKDLDKIKIGEIIVTPMTELDYIPFLRRVKAIITDEGGITCHAAIVAREMKKPCIIATKIATKVLKDGDRIEVDANKGIVRKL